MIRIGHQYLADISDGLKVDAKLSNLSIEKLDQGGYIERAGLVGSKSFTYNLTEKAIDVLPQLSEIDSKMIEDYLVPKYYKFMEMAENSPEKIAKFAKEYNMASLQMSSMVSHLNRRGYIKETGIFKRQVEITEKGKAMIQKYAVSGGVA
jgi:SSS family solute:Na+ symporter